MVGYSDHAPPVNAVALARALGGEVVGRQVLAPGPGHTRDDRSLSIHFESTAPDGFRVHSFAGDDWQACRDYVRERARLPQWEPGNGRRKAALARSAGVGADKDARNMAFADRLFREAQPIAGTPGEAWLAARGILLDEVPRGADLRFSPCCPFGTDHDGMRRTAGCILARFTDVTTGEVRGLHRRSIERGTPKKTMALGITHGAVIRLWPDEDVGKDLVVGEGIETVLAAATRIRHRGSMLRPAWACTTAGLLEALPVLAGVERLTILADHDASGTGQRAARRCAERWTAAGREVRILTPRRPGVDFNDLVRPA